MILEVLNTGSELLLGKILNTHVRFLAERLFPLGLRISRQVAVPDAEPIREAIAETFGRVDILLVTGGLGPTTDDLTREMVADLLGLELVHDEAVMRAITERYARRGSQLTDRVGRQAMKPEGALVLPNENGTAPGLYLEARELAAGLADPAYATMTPHIFLLPGPPRELYPMFDELVLPILRQIAPAQPEMVYRNYRIAGLGESSVEERVGEELLELGLELGYCAHPGEVEVRTIGSPEQVDAAAEIMLRNLGSHIISTDDRNIEQTLVARLSERKETVAVAESCTGGYIAHDITNVPGASAVFLQGFVTYANEAKTAALGVDAELIRTRGAVSYEVAAAMANGALKASGATYALATTGIAGPGGGTQEKPVGTVYIALASKHSATRVEHFLFTTDRETFKELVARTAMDMLRREIAMVERTGK